MFPGIASLALSVEGEGIPFAIRIVKKEQGIPIHIVPEGTPGASVVAVKRVDELGFYSLGHYGLAEKTGLTSSQTTALVRHLRLQEDTECFKEFRIGRSVHKRYSPKAIERIRSEVPKLVRAQPDEELLEGHAQEEIDIMDRRRERGAALRRPRQPNGVQLFLSSATAKEPPPRR